MRSFSKYFFVILIEIVLFLILNKLTLFKKDQRNQNKLSISFSTDEIIKNSNMSLVLFDNGQKNISGLISALNHINYFNNNAEISFLDRIENEMNCNKELEVQIELQNLINRRSKFYTSL